MCASYMRHKHWGKFQKYSREKWGEWGQRLPSAWHISRDEASVSADGMEFRVVFSLSPASKVWPGVA